MRLYISLIHSSLETRRQVPCQGHLHFFFNVLTVVMGIVHYLELSGYFYLGLHRFKTLIMAFFLFLPRSLPRGKALFMRHLVSYKNGFKIDNNLVWLDLYSHRPVTIHRSISRIDLWIPSILSSCLNAELLS